jgi:TolB-like protein
LLVALWVLAAAAPAHGETRVAVMEFSNASPSHDMDALGKGLQSMITTDLSEVQTLRLVERERLNDIQSELKLQRSSLIDKATAARIGKLAGATHLCGGTFTVIGAKMRIDARVFSAQSGEILLAEQIEGDKDAFFDLEKSLVKKVIAAAGVKLAPKERVAVERVHTTDFQAFQKYSEGMQAFDDKRYDDALGAMRQAAKLDGDFKLALRTLEDYQQIVGRLKHQRSAIDAKELRENEAELARTRESIARGNYLSWYNIYQIHYREPKDRGDRFARERAIDDAARQYFDAAIKGWRDWYSIPHPPDVFHKKGERGDTPITPPVIDNLFLEAYEEDDSRTRHKHMTAVFCTTQNALVQLAALGNDYFAGVKLHYDEHQIAALQEELTRMAIPLIKTNACFDKLEAELRPLRGALERHLAAVLRTNLEFKRSTQVLEEAARATDDRDELQKITAEVEYNRDLEAVFAAAGNKDLMRQLLQGWWLIDIKNRDEVLAAARGFKDPKTIGRSFNLNDYVVVNKTPVWLVRGGLLTGPRSDDRHADEIRYYAGGGSLAAWTKKQPAEAVTVLGGQQVAAARTSFTVDRAPGGDWFADEPVGTERPELGLVFGLTNVASSTDPPHGWTVLIGGPTVRLAEFTGERELKLQVKEEQPAEFAGAQKLTVAFELGAESVTATVNGKRFSFHIPRDHTGFYGLHFRGQGFASVKALEAR